MSQEETESPESKHYANWEETHAVIGQAFIDLVGELQKRPSIRDIAKHTGYGINTVHVHLREIKKKSLEDRFEPLQVLSDRLLLKLFKTAQGGGKGSVAATKLFFQLVENWKPGMTIEMEESNDLSNLTLDELIKREKELGSDIDKKLLRFKRPAGNNKKTGS